MKHHPGIRSIRSAALLAATLLAGASLRAAAQQPSGARLAGVLSQMDAASQRFRSAEADFTQTFYEAVVHENTTQTGSVYFERKGAGTEMGAVLHLPGSSAVDRVISYKDGTLSIFDPRVDQIQQVAAGANSSQADTFLTLGFGGSGKALAAAWNITDDGPETLTVDGAPVATEKLDLVSKQAGVRQNFSHVLLWIDPVRGVSVRQVFITPAGDKRTSDYNHIRLNGKIDASAFAIKRDSKTTVIRH